MGGVDAYAEQLASGVQWVQRAKQRGDLFGRLVVRLARPDRRRLEVDAGAPAHVGVDQARRVLDHGRDRRLRQVHDKAADAGARAHGELVADVLGGIGVATPGGRNVRAVRVQRDVLGRKRLQIERLGLFQCNLTLIRAAHEDLHCPQVDAALFDGLGARRPNVVGDRRARRRARRAR